MTQAVTQAILVVQPSMQNGKATEKIALFDSAGNPVTMPEIGSAILLTGYTTHAVGSVLATDTVNVAIAKLEARIAVLEA
jgi:hypothetical protein